MITKPDDCGAPIIAIEGGIGGGDETLGLTWRYLAAACRRLIQAIVRLAASAMGAVNMIGPRCWSVTGPMWDRICVDGAPYCNFVWISFVVIGEAWTCS